MSKLIKLAVLNLVITFSLSSIIIYTIYGSDKEVPSIKEHYCIVDSVETIQPLSSLQIEPTYVVHTSCNKKITFTRKIQWVKGDTITTLIEKL